MSTPDRSVDVGDVHAARRRIAASVVRTPLVPSTPLSRAVGVPVSLKLETVQPTGSFKVRGATSKLLALDAAAARRGVVTASTGNHGRAVAHVAGEHGIAATVCVSEQVPAGKLAALEALGCDVIVGGGSQADALVTAARLVDDRGMTLVHPFDDAAVIAGQGTIGLELLEQDPDLHTVLVPLSGGGLFAGVALAIKASHPHVRLVGVSMERAPVMARSLGAGRPVDMPEQPTLADSLQGGIGGDANRHTFALVREHLDEVVLLTEVQIWAGMRFALDQHRLVLEGGGAVGIAALLAGALEVTGPVSVICSGANAEAHHIEAMARGDVPPDGR